jgi:hypothetical protein
MIIVDSERIEHILAEIESEHQVLTKLLSGLPACQVSSRAGDEWSAVDALVHITAWQNNALEIARLQAAPDAPDLNPRSSPAGILRLNVDQFNEKVFNAHRDWGLDQAMAWHNATHADLQSALAALPPERLLGGPGKHGARMWYWRPAVVHSREHRHRIEKRLLIPSSD